jgi:uncharacterized membrane protein
MSDTGEKIITTMLLLVVNTFLYVIFLMIGFSHCGSSCNKKKRDVSLLILYLIVTVIIPYYILVIIWGFTKMNYVFGAFMLYNVLYMLHKFKVIRKPLFQ